MEVMFMAKRRKTFRKVITSPELIEQINHKNNLLILIFSNREYHI